MRGRVFVNVEKCVICKRCMVACAVEHSQSGNLFEAILEDPPPRTRILLSKGKGTIPVSCRHCADAPCLEVCPSKAISRKSPDDPVIWDSEVCIGCTACVIACPFGVLEEPTTPRCDLCIDRLDNDQAFACVEACPTGARVSTALITFTIDESCNGCMLCKKRCPADAIEGKKKEPHTIDQDKCIKCGICKDVCKFGSVIVK